MLRPKAFDRPRRAILTSCNTNKIDNIAQTEYHKLFNKNQLLIATLADGKTSTLYQA
jgi:hypothetical protein